MRTNALKEKLRRGQPAIGAFCNFPSPAVAEMLGILGLDFIIVDCEHSAMTPETAEHMYLAAEVRGLATVTRVGENSPQVVQKYLEAGTQGVQMPMVNTFAEAQRAVDAVKYPPLGKRGLAGSRPSDFGLTDMTKYVEQANQETLVCVQIETMEGVGNIAEIAKLPAIDILFFGPSDLSAALGYPGQARHPEVIALIERLGAITVEAGKVAGTIARDRADYEHWRGKGFLYLATGVSNFLARGAQEYIKETRGAEQARG